MKEVMTFGDGTHMTREEFVEMTMSLGVSKESAEQRADLAAEHEMPYEFAFLLNFTEGESLLEELSREDDEVNNLLEDAIPPHCDFAALNSGW